MEALNQVKDLWTQVFPHSHGITRKASFGTNSFYFKGYLQYPEEWNNRISNNDPLSYTAWFDVAANTYTEETLALFIKPNKPYLAYSVAKINKKTIKNVTPEKLLKRFNEIKAFVRDNADNMVHDISDKV